MIKKLALAGIGFAMLATPLLASAQAAGNQAEIARLTALIQTLLAEIAQLKGGSGTSCITISHNLTLGSTGGDVVSLQNYLASKGYLNAKARGYYGFLTAQAVGKLQLSLGIVSSANDPAYGITGPKTRAAIACGSNPQPQTVTSTNTGSMSGTPSATIEQTSAGTPTTTTTTTIIGIPNAPASGSVTVTGVAAAAVTNQSSSSTEKTSTSTDQTSIATATSSLNYLDGMNWIWGLPDDSSVTTVDQRDYWPFPPAGHILTVYMYSKGLPGWAVQYWKTGDLYEGVDPIYEYAWFSYENGTWVHTSSWRYTDTGSYLVEIDDYYVNDATSSMEQWDHPLNHGGLMSIGQITNSLAEVYGNCSQPYAVGHCRGGIWNYGTPSPNNYNVQFKMAKKNFDLPALAGIKAVVNAESQNIPGKTDNSINVMGYGTVGSYAGALGLVYWVDYGSGWDTPGTPVYAQQISYQ